MLEVKNLTKKYGDHLAVDNLSFTVEKGQILGFLGPNGAGKSTTMNMITGYISATEGTVSISGHDMYEEPEEAKKYIGYLPELPPLYQDMTVKEYLRFVANIKKVKKHEVSNMLHKVMDMTMIADVSNRLIKHLSKGYKQRVGLAGALIGFPEVLILDEPTVGLDPAQITWVRDLIKELSKEHAIILSSHILSEISAICDKVIIINKGKLVASDSPENLIHHAKNGNAITLSIKGNKEYIEAALLKVDKINHMDFETEGMEEGTVGVTIYSEKEIDLREDVFYALSDARCPILKMDSFKMTLEDIFLQVTRQEQELQDESNENAGDEDNRFNNVADVIDEDKDEMEENNASHI